MKVNEWTSVGERSTRVGRVEDAIIGKAAKSTGYRLVTRRRHEHRRRHKIRTGRIKAPPDETPVVQYSCSSRHLARLDRHLDCV